MNEFIVDGETGFLVPVAKNREFNQFSKENAYEIKVHDLENVINRVVSLAENEIVEESAKNPNVRRHYIIWWAWKVHAGERGSASLDKLIAKTKRSRKFVNLMYNFDDPYCWEEKHWNMNAVAKLFDLVFVTSKKRLSDYENNGAKAYYVPLASWLLQTFMTPINFRPWSLA